jgi:Uma2 family endonuclease
MTTVPRSSHPRAEVPDLNSGDRMTREEFHRIYSQMPEGFRAELVEGIVYVASPLKLRHSEPHVALSSVFAAYRGSTPGVQVGDNATILLGELAEPQPDLFLRILPEFGGQSRTSKDDYVEGAPELIAEVAYTTRSVDLHAKRNDYQRHGVLEYLVADVGSQRLHWMDLAAGADVPVGQDGVVRPRVFPGLWVDSAALFRNDYAALMSTLQQGLASPEHAEFVRKLAAAGPGRAAS